MKKNNIVLIRYFSWLASLLVMVIIFMMSSQNAAQSSETSKGFIDKLLELFYNGYKEMPEDAKKVLIKSLQHIVRSLAHFSIYFPLGFFLFSAFNTYEIKLINKIFLSSGLSLLYSGFDEYYQTFVDGRSGQIKDIVIDFSGAFCGIMLFVIFRTIYISFKFRSKNMRKKELFKRLEELVLTVENLNKDIKELEGENESLRFELDMLKSKNDAPEENLNNLEDDKNKYNGFTVKVIDEVELSNKDSEPILSNRSLEFGASVIGKITVESAKYCDMITELNSDNNKELLGLIMGKSELCKNEILNIAVSELNDDLKFEMINTQFDEAVDYFKSVVQQ